MLKQLCVMLSVAAAVPALAQGKPKNTPAKKEATEEAKAVVRNYLAEATLNSRVRVALLKNLKGSDGLRISVEVNGGTVTLTGEVQERATQKLAPEVVKSVDGAKFVKNLLTLSKDAPHQDDMAGKVHDAMLESSVKLRLLQEVGEVAMKIEVEAADTTVSLRGAVPDVATKEKLVASARKVEGVKDVTDLIKAP